MPVLNLNHRELESKRFHLLTRSLNGREDIALGVLTHLWVRSLKNKSEAFNRPDRLDYICGPLDKVDEVLLALTTAGYLKLVYGCYMIVDTKPWIERAHIRVARAVKAGQKSAKVRAKKRLALKKIERAQAMVVAEEDEITVASRACWAAYADAYETLFHVAPVRNVKINSLIKQLVKRIPMADAPLVLRFYVGHGNSFYAQRMYPLDLAVKDAESLHTQWKLNKPITKATMEKFNQREKMRDALEEGVIF